MRVRTVTAGIKLSFMRLDEQVESVGDELHRIRDRLLSKGYEVQSVRLSTQPWSQFPVNGGAEAAVQGIAELEDASRKNGIDFLSVGPAMTPDAIRAVPKILERTSSVCCSAYLGDCGSGVVADNVVAASGSVSDISRLARNGSRNFMFASLSSCPPDIPFFPAAYHLDDRPCYTIGLETGDVVNRSMTRADGLKDATNLLSHNLNVEMNKVLQTLAPIERTCQLLFKGFDTSLCPGLDEEGSIALSVEGLMGSPFGSQGTLSACAAMTMALDDVNIPRSGYCGLMLPVMEDVGLAKASDLGSIDIQKLLLYSSVCGTGLDTVPIPGDTPQSLIACILWDIAYQSVRLKKPLSARLLPIPDKRAGASTGLSSPYLKDCAIMSVI